MVLVVNPAPGSGASGSIRADTYSHNRFGSYVRNRTIPVNPQSARQTVVRSALSQLTTRWAQTLDQDQRDAWDLYAESVVMKNHVGQDVFLTGFNHYLRSNVPRLQMAEAVVDDGPTIFELPEADPTYAFTGSEATQVLTLAYDANLAWADETGGFLMHYQGKPQNPQRTFFNGPWRLLGRTVGETGVPPASPDLIGVQYAIAELQRQWVYARILRADGRISQMFQAEIPIDA